jgi:hypothetical protein
MQNAELFLLVEWLRISQKDSAKWLPFVHISHACVIAKDMKWSNISTFRTCSKQLTYLRVAYLWTSEIGDGDERRFLQHSPRRWWRYQGPLQTVQYSAAPNAEPSPGLSDRCYRESPSLRCLGTLYNTGLYAHWNYRRQGSLGHFAK